MYGRFEADFIDQLDEDPISPERQRVNWSHPQLTAFRKWGKQKIIEATNKWKANRAQSRLVELETKLGGFQDRLMKLQPHERSTIESALKKVASVSNLSNSNFQELCSSMLLAWESGRLKALIHSLSELKDPTPEAIIESLTEAEVLTNLQIAEAVVTKIEAIGVLERFVTKREVENSLRDYIAKHPYFLSPEYENYAIETKVDKILLDAAREAGLHADDYNGRIDLALKAGTSLLIVEFMRPGLPLDWDHAQRLQRYVSIVTERVRAVTGLQIDRVQGLIVADKVDAKSGMSVHIENLRTSGILVHEWESLLQVALAQWREFREILLARSPDDQRILDALNREQ